MDDGGDWEPSTSEANKGTSKAEGKPRSGGGRRKPTTKKPAPTSKKRVPKASKKQSKSADWADVRVESRKEFVPFFSPDSVLTDEIDEKWVKIIEKAAEEVIILKKNSIKEEFDDLFSDDEQDDEQDYPETESEFDEEDEDADHPEPPIPKLVATAPPVENEPRNMIYFEPISENVKGRNEYQLSNTPLVNEQTKDMAICSGVYKHFENGIHGYLEDTFEWSQQIVFNVMKRVLENKDANFIPDFFYYSMYRVFPNTGCQKEFADMFPKLALMFTEDEDELKRLLALEDWKVEQVAEEKEKPLDYKHPLSEGNYFFKTIQLTHDDNHCSPNCYKTISAQDMAELLKRFEPVADTLRLYLRKNCTRADAPFLNALVLSDVEELVADFCAVSRRFDTRTCAAWAELVIKHAKPTAVHEKPKSHSEKYHAFLKKTARETALHNKEFKKQLEKNGESDKKVLVEDAILQTCTRLKPCCHFGPCGPDVPDCSCGRVCSVYCQCDENCSQKYPGCMCAPNKCGSKKCQCRKMSWECIEGACKSCLKSTASIPEPWCQNHFMTMRKGKLVECRRSLIAGNGAFLKEDADVDDYIGEYTGEIIGEDETERRGKVYELSTSYIVGLPWQQGSIDAGRAGNVLRFVNHSARPNCHVVMRIVRGKPTSGFYAKRKMTAGTELTFDYNYNETHAIKYFQSKPEDRVPKIKRRMYDDSPSSSPSPPPPPRKRRRKNRPHDENDDPNKPSTSSEIVSYK